METSERREIQRRSIAMLPSEAWAMRREPVLALYAELTAIETQLGLAHKQIDELAQALSQQDT